MKQLYHLPNNHCDFMRYALKIEALCWDTESMVIAKNVHDMENLSIYPPPECVAGVIAKHGGKNF
ncbi:hypothetical protein QR66_00305 [Chromobacterium piscinae]|nr:hypothetical protein QR66_00305 [Chromobacterium piscinae]